MWVRSTCCLATAAVTELRRVTLNWRMRRARHVVVLVRASVWPLPQTTTRCSCRNNASPANSTSVRASHSRRPNLGLFLCRHFWVDLMKWVSNVVYVVHHSSTSIYTPNLIEIEETFCGRTDVRTDVRTSTKCFFDINEIWHVDGGRWMMHDFMHYDPIQGQGQGHEKWAEEANRQTQAVMMKKQLLKQRWWRWYCEQRLS